MQVIRFSFTGKRIMFGSRQDFGIELQDYVFPDIVEHTSDQLPSEQG
jgi:hypothetical protein